MELRRPAHSSTEPCFGDDVRFDFLRENPAVKNQLPSTTRLERRASSGTHKGVDACGKQADGRAPGAGLYFSDMLRLRKLPTCIFKSTDVLLEDPYE